MATTVTEAPSVLGPVPFKDVVPDADVMPEPEPEEYEGIVAALPSKPRLQLRRFQGMWVRDSWVPGILAIQRAFAPRPGDVLIASPPKCGTTWLKALAFAVMARRAHPPASPDHPLLRLNPHDCVPALERPFAAGWGSRIDALPSPRLMSVHMHHSALPDSISKNPDCKIVFVSRDPKDMLVSLWHFLRRFQPDVSFAELVDGACEGSCLGGPFWDHVLGYWNASKESPDAVLFLRYEDMLLDPAGNVRRFARFVGLPFSEAEEAAGAVADVVRLCSFDRQSRLKVNNTGSDAPFAIDVYFRKGKAGDWANHMTPEMAASVDAVVEEKLRGSGLASMSA